LQIEEVAKALGLVDHELKTVLEFYHDLGVIVYFGGAGRFDVTLGKTIILHPQWFIDMFTRIINAQDGENEVRASCILWIELDEK
jgi:hypothetical protein